MPRVPRIVVPEVALHVVQRGNNRAECFFTEGDYRDYLQYLAFFAPRSECSVHAYCLMPNHVHLLITPHSPDGCSLLMKQLSQCYVQRVNRSTGRTGTLWEGRFYSCPVPSDYYALACYRYIELNPARAGIVSHPAEYRWSSYGVNAEGYADALIEPHAAYAALATECDRRRLAYRGLFDSSLGCDVVDDIRAATRSGAIVGKHRRRGRPPKKGSDPFSS